jgi:hypothetical protein
VTQKKIAAILFSIADGFVVFSGDADLAAKEEELDAELTTTERPEAGHMTSESAAELDDVDVPIEIVTTPSDAKRLDAVDSASGVPVASTGVGQKRRRE